VVTVYSRATKLARYRRATLAAVAIVLAVVVDAAGGVAGARPQGTIAFASNRTGNVELYSIRADGTQLGQLTRTRATEEGPLFSPDGQRILFLRGGELWVMNADGSRQRRLARSAYNPSWSPDSRRVAYDDFKFIAVVGVDGRRLLRIRGQRASWSPDGRWLAFERQAGDRTDLAIVGSDGHGLRAIRRGIGRLLSWSPAGGLIAYWAKDDGIDVVQSNGRGARRLLRPYAYGFVWSPDGRRFAFEDGTGLHVASLAGGSRRILASKGLARLEVPAWSPDGGWIAVSIMRAQATSLDLLVLAADGSSSRRIAIRAPRPYGSDIRSPSWRPRGVTAARLGRRPAAPLPSERVSASTFQAAATGSIGELAADGARVAVVVDFAGGCASVEVWEPLRRRAVQLKRPCRPDEASNREGTREVTLAGTRAAWLSTAGGNSLEQYVETATLTRRRPVGIASEFAPQGDADYGAFVAGLAGDGSLLAFAVEQRCSKYQEGEFACPPDRRSGHVVAATVWRIAGGRRACPAGCARVTEATSELTVLAVDRGRIAVRTETGVRLLAADGRTLREFAVKARTAALSGSRLAVRTTDAVELYDSDSGLRTAQLPVAGNVRLEDLEGEILVTAAGGTITLRRLDDGRTTTIRRGRVARAQLEPPGLFVAAARTVTFTPRRQVLRRLGD
jgi:WD40-like Beta Propeller Repeat